jgi:CubicO group peptidase (beta-lactamase class C family)
MGEDAIFRIFSMTKPVTSVAILMLYEEGRFQLDCPIARFMPELGPLRVRVTDNGSEKSEALARPITIHDLLTHTSGLGYGLGPADPVETKWYEADLLRMDENLADKVARIAGLPLHHQPGKRYTYSIASDILGRLVELASGMPLDDFFRTRIFEPLGMVDTGFYVPPAKIERLATLYTPGPDGLLADVARMPATDLPGFLKGIWVDKSVRPQFLSGGGGLVSTVGDYLRFALMLRGGGKLEGSRLLGRKTVELMTTACLDAGQFPLPGCSFGLGVMVVRDPARMAMPVSVGTFAAAGAANTEFWVDPKEDYVGVLMSQLISQTPISLGPDFRVGAAQALVDDGKPGLLP